MKEKYGLALCIMLAMALERIKEIQPEKWEVSFHEYVHVDKSNFKN